MGKAALRIFSVTKEIGGSARCNDKVVIRQSTYWCLNIVLVTHNSGDCRHTEIKVSFLTEVLAERKGNEWALILPKQPGITGAETGGNCACRPTLPEINSHKAYRQKARPAKPPPIITTLF